MGPALNSRPATRGEQARNRSRLRASCLDVVTESQTLTRPGTCSLNLCDGRVDASSAYTLIVITLVESKAWHVARDAIKAAAFVEVRGAVSVLRKLWPDVSLTRHCVVLDVRASGTQSHRETSTTPGSPLRCSALAA